MIRGRKWHDVDSDGTPDAGEPGLSGWTIYVDANNNGLFNSEEQWARTGEDGSYSLTLWAGNVYDPRGT